MVITPLIILTLAILARLWQAHRHQAQLTALIDAYAEMTGDLLLKLINTIKEGK